MTRVHVTPDWLESSDFFQICRWRTSMPTKKPFLVSGDHIKGIVGLGVVEVAETASWVHFLSASGVLFSTRRYLDPYPDLSAYMNVTGEVMPLPKYLTESIKLALPFATDNPDGERVRVDLKPGRLTLSAEGASGGYRDRRKFSYNGKPLSFLVAPKVLADLAKNYSDCVVSDGCIKVVGDKFEYLIRLIQEG